MSPSQVNHVFPGNSVGIWGMMFSFIFRITSSEDNGSWEGPLAPSVTTAKSPPGVVASAEMSKDVKRRETGAQGPTAESHLQAFHACGPISSLCFFIFP